ncbi:ATP-binding protein [Mucilaginibacter calamicampi]|uniref:histidine kinase n=2 Tax=Mucilaginibacter calamicampi TaxID=1302352 RepID=A0ABW2YUX6_9SPHI
MRYGLVVLLFVVLFVSTEYLLLHYQKADALRNNIGKLISARENSELIDSCIIKLNNADNNARLYTVTGEKYYFQRSSADIDDVLGISEKLRLGAASGVNQNTAQNLSDLIKQKKAKSNEYIKLKILNDKLIDRSKTIVQSLTQVEKQIDKPAVKVEHTITFDTVTVSQPEQNIAAQPKKKFFGKLISSLNPKNRLQTNKNETGTPVEKEVIVKKDTVVYKQVLNKAAITRHTHAYKTYSNNLNTVNDKLRDKEEELLLLNNNLTQQIISGLKNYRASEIVYAENSKNFLQKNLAGIFWEFKKVSVVNFLFVVFLLVLVFYNIWKIFRNEQLIIEYSEKAEEYAQAKSNFLAGMSHEIRTPLNSVIGFSEQLTKSVLSSTQKEQVMAIRNSSEMLLELVNEILDFSKYETGKMNFDSQPFLPCNAVEDIFTTMHIHAKKKGIQLEKYNNVPENFCCDGDATRLKQVIMNLLGNAIKFTVKGKVTLYADIDKSHLNNPILKVSVIDTGLGIDKDDLPHIFEEFSQVEKAQKATRHKGTGLGLAICKKIIELQGGSIKVTSTPGVGSTFSFELPLKITESNDCVADKTLNIDFIADIVRGKHALIVDDNRFNVLLAATILKKWKITYDEAYNGLEATRLIDANDYDIVLTDIEMPEFDGLQLMEYIRTHNDESKANTLIMALTANVLKEDRDKYVMAGANDVVVKPFLEHDLIGKIAANIQHNISAIRFIA